MSFLFEFLLQSSVVLMDAIFHSVSYQNLHFFRYYLYLFFHFKVQLNEHKLKFNY